MMDRDVASWTQLGRLSRSYRVTAESLQGSSARPDCRRSREREWRAQGCLSWKFQARRSLSLDAPTRAAFLPMRHIDQSPRYLERNLKVDVADGQGHVTGG